MKILFSVATHEGTKNISSRDSTNPLDDAQIFGTDFMEDDFSGLMMHEAENVIEAALQRQNFTYTNTTHGSLSPLSI